MTVGFTVVKRPKSETRCPCWERLENEKQFETISVGTILKCNTCHTYWKADGRMLVTLDGGRGTKLVTTWRKLYWRTWWYFLAPNWN